MVTESPAVQRPATGSRNGRATSDRAAAPASAGSSESVVPEARPKGALLPALLRPYLDLETIRYDYPVVLLENSVEPTTPIAPLADLIDGLLRRIDPGTRDVGSLRRRLYGLETRIKRRVETEPGIRLSTVWAAAARDLVAETADEERRAALSDELDAAREAMAADGAVLPCGPGSVAAIVEHAWRRLRAEQAAADAAALADLSGRISDLIDAERARSPQAMTPEALGASMPGPHVGVDFEALSKLLAQSGRRQGPSRRARRLREPLRVIEEGRRRLLDDRSGPALPRTIDDGLAAWRRESTRQAHVLRAIRLATLELRDHRRRDRQEALAGGTVAETPGLGGSGALPPTLLALDADALGLEDEGRLLALLGSEIPLKIVLTVRRAFGERAPAVNDDSGRQAGNGDWAVRIGQATLLAGEAFVLQASASQLPRMGSEIEAALRYEGPALIAVYVGPGATEHGPQVPVYVRCAAAVESRAFPSFVSDPSQGTDWYARFSLRGDPEPEAAWPRHGLVYEDLDGAPAGEEVSFTTADLLVLDQRFRAHFEPIPHADLHPRMAPVADVAADGTGAAAASLPFIYVVDDDDRLYRAVVSPEIVALTRSSAANWARLQALARAGAPVAVPEAAPSPSLGEPTVPEAPTPAEAIVPATTPEPPGPATASAAPAPGVAYIESAACTTCDECTKRNSQMFAYNAQKQAYIKDPRAGTFREMVEAAENCPVCIIHPGEPVDPSEPGLDDLLKRAAAFA